MRYSRDRMQSPPLHSAGIQRRALILTALFALGCQKQAELPDFGQVPEFSLVDQESRPIRRSTLAGQVWVAAFMFTRCPTICPRIMRRMQQVSETSNASDVDLRLVSVSVDPENDTPAVLNEYAKRLGADLTRWSFVTGDFKVIQKTAVDGFKLALEGRADAGARDFGIIHGSHLVLVDRKAQIRGYYRSDDDAELSRLIADAKRL